MQRATIRHRPLRLLGATILAAGLTLTLSASAALAQGPGHPGGNNGTVKVHESTTSVEVRRNEPHVCSFYLAFFSADAAQSGSWEILDWDSGRTVVASGTYLTDAEGFYRTADMVLDDGHYRVNWQGINDTSWKHKMFWVDCSDEAQSNEHANPPGESGEQGSQPPGEGGEQGSQSGGQGGEGVAAAVQSGQGQSELPDSAMAPLGVGNAGVALGLILVTIATAFVSEHRRRGGLSS